MSQVIVPDFSEALETGGAVTPGKYTVRIESHETKTAKSGNNYLKWKLVIFGAEGELSKFNNWPVFYNTMLSGPGAGMLRSLLTAAGITLEPGQGFDPSDLLGKEVVATLAQGKNQDGTPSEWPEVKRITPIING